NDFPSLTLLGQMAGSEDVSPPLRVAAIKGMNYMGAFVRRKKQPTQDERKGLEQIREVLERILKDYDPSVDENADELIEAAMSAFGDLAGPNQGGLIFRRFLYQRAYTPAASSALVNMILNEPQRCKPLVKAFLQWRPSIKVDPSAVLNLSPDDFLMYYT